MTLPIITRAVTAHDTAAISALHARVFGPGRFTRTAYRVREGKGLTSRFCRAADLTGRLIATIRLSEVTIGGAGHAALLGPLAVDPEFHGEGYGRQLVGEAMEQMRAAGVRLVVLVGDEPYYGRFGFRPVPADQIVLPGPVNPARILAAELVPGVLADYRGTVAGVAPGIASTF